MNTMPIRIPIASLAAILSLLLAVLPAAAAQIAEPPDLPAQYSHALGLTVSGQQGVVGFRLPQSVYLNARSAALADLRVFDATGTKQPFALYAPSPQTLTQQQAWAVKRFPVTANSAQPQSVDGISLDIKTGSDGTLISVKTGTDKTAQTEADEKLIGLVLDVGRPEEANRPLIGALRFKLPTTRSAYSGQVWLEVSDELIHWETIGTAELSWLVNPQTAETLSHDLMEFAPRRFRYARLSWRQGEPIDFADIIAESVEQTADSPLLENLTLQAEPGKTPGDWLYRAGIAIPVEKIELRFNEPNVVLPAEIGRYQERPAKTPGQRITWVFQPVTRSVFYQINQAGNERRSGVWPVPLSHSAEWVVRPQTPNASQPELKLIWQPATLVFLAAGQPPYTLAFGRNNAQAAAVELAQVAPGFSTQELRQIEQAQAGPLQIQQTPQADDIQSAEQKANAAAQTRTLILWAVLLAGVAVLGTMVWRLFRQMQAD
jgi:hypothetical protein